MRFVRNYRFVLLFFLLLIFCSVMVVRQFGLKQSRHVELNYTNEARVLFDRLVLEVPKYTKKISDKELLDDFQRTLMLVDPYSNQTNNLIWKYHWMLSEELDKRSVDLLARARKLAEEK
jgi:hypothetical protein